MALETDFGVLLHKNKFLEIDLAKIRRERDEYKCEMARGFQLAQNLAKSVLKKRRIPRSLKREARRVLMDGKGSES